MLLGKTRYNVQTGPPSELFNLLVGQLHGREGLPVSMQPLHLTGLCSYKNPMPHVQMYGSGLLDLEPLGCEQLRPRVVQVTNKWCQALSNPACFCGSPKLFGQSNLDVV